MPAQEKDDQLNFDEIAFEKERNGDPLRPHTPEQFAICASHHTFMHDKMHKDI